MSTRVYKTANVGFVRVLVIMDVPEDARTNFKRIGIHDPAHAWYRVDKVNVVDIEDAQGNHYPSATSSFIVETPLTYRVGEQTEEPAWDTDIEAVNTRGIHVFLSKHQAEMYGKHARETGTHSAWYPNGQRSEERDFQKGVSHGLYRAWSYFGMLLLESRWKNGMLDGLSREWDGGGILIEETEYDADEVVSRKRWCSLGFLLEDYKTNKSVL